MDVTIYRLAKNIGKTLHNIAQTPKQLANKIDNTLEYFSDKQIDKHFNKADHNALKDPKYAQIEAKRHQPNSTYITFLSQDLTIKDWEYQQQIREKLTPTPKLMPLYRYLNNHPIKTLTNKIKHAHQRLTRSWDDTATWSLDHHLTLTLGNQLKHLAETTHGWPQSETYPQFEDWQKALHKNGNYLITYANKDDIIFTETSYNQQAEEKIIKNAQKALRWVATNLPALWD